MDSLRRISSGDLDSVLNAARPAFESLKNARIFLTGGSGFFGKWLTETFLWANQKLNLNANLTILSRDPEQIPLALPHLARNPALRFHTGDIASFQFPLEKFTHLIHAATPAIPKFHRTHPLETFQTIVSGTQHTLEFAKQAGVRRFLFLSSGAIYGSPRDLDQISETDLRGPEPFSALSSYSEGKRAAEFLCHSYQSTSLECVSARCFSFLGPHIPLNNDYAAGDFIQNILQNKPIQIQGDGTAVRSYLYMSDLSAWLWTLLVSGKAGEAYNVGAEKPHSILELAQAIRTTAQTLKLNPQDIQIAKKSDPHLKPARYVPSTQKIRKALAIQETVTLSDAITRTLKFYSQLDSASQTR